jgi:hypothetical protein
MASERPMAGPRRAAGNLPVANTSFVGRRREIAEVRRRSLAAANTVFSARRRMRNPPTDQVDNPRIARRDTFPALMGREERRDVVRGGLG